MVSFKGEVHDYKEIFEVLNHLGLIHLVCNEELGTIQAAFFTEEDAKGWLDSFVTRSGHTRYSWLVKEGDGITRRYVSSH